MGVPVPVICCLIAGVVVVLIFCGAFFVDLFFPGKKRTEDTFAQAEETQDYDIDEMLSKLEEKSRVVEEKAVEEKKENSTVIQPVISKSVFEEKAETTEKKEEEFDFDALFKQLQNETNNVQEETPVEVPEVEPVTAVVVNEKDLEKNTSKSKKTETIEIVEEVHEKKTVKSTDNDEVKPIVRGPEFDYYVRMETIKESLTKLEKDLLKATKEVNKYEKTNSRKERNEKLLDKKSAELTNLNLVLYNVNNIDEIDPEKKKKQEDLVEHIGELKKSIKDAKEFLSANKEKYLNSKKIKDFLTGEKSRYVEEITELEQLIAENKKNKK